MSGRGGPPGHVHCRLCFYQWGGMTQQGHGAPTAPPTPLRQGLQSWTRAWSVRPWCHLLPQPKSLMCAAQTARVAGYTTGRGWLAGTRWTNINCVPTFSWYIRKQAGQEVVASPLSSKETWQLPPTGPELLSLTRPQTCCHVAPDAVSAIHCMPVASSSSLSASGRWGESCSLGERAGKSGLTVWG